jgi:surface antigen
MRSLRHLAAALAVPALLAACGGLSGTRHSRLPDAHRPALPAAVAGRGGPLAFADGAAAAPGVCEGGRPCTADDYPFRAAPAGGVDPWDFPYRQCTSFVAYRVNLRGTRSGRPFARTYLGRPFGDARWWDDAAREAGLTVHAEPAVGRVAQWEANEGGAGEWGHVALVAEVYAPGDILVEEYNWVRGAYTRRRLTADGGFWPSHFIEI